MARASRCAAVAPRLEGETKMTREMPREGNPTEVVEDRIPLAETLRDGDPVAAGGGIPPAGIPRGDKPIAGVGDIPLEEAEVDPGFSGNPMKFAVHAVLYYAGKAADKIVSLYSRAFRLDREYVADFSRSTGIAHVEGGRWEKAIPLLEKALAITPDDQETRMHLARACGAANRHERAYLHLEKALKASPNSARVLRALGDLCSRRQDYERAIQYLTKAVKLDPDHAQSFYRLGAAYDNRKLYDEAVDSFKEAIRMDPRFAKAYQALGFTYEGMGDRESAVECFKKALELE